MLYFTYQFWEHSKILFFLKLITTFTAVRRNSNKYTHLKITRKYHGRNNQQQVYPILKEYQPAIVKNELIFPKELNHYLFKTHLIKQNHGKNFRLYCKRN